RAENDQQEKDDEAGGFHLEGEYFLTVIENAAGEESGKHRALAKEDWAEGVGTLAEESEPGATVGMSGDQVEIQAGDLPEKAKPDEKPEIPAEEDELNERDADQYVPEARRGQAPAPAWIAVPGGRLESEPARPEREADAIDQDDETDFERNGIA